MMALDRIDFTVSTTDNTADEAEETVTFAVCFAQPLSSQLSLPAYFLGKTHAACTKTVVRSAAKPFNLLHVSYVSKLQYFFLLWSTTAAA